MVKEESDVEVTDLKEWIPEILSGVTLLFFAILIFWIGGVLASGVLLGLISSLGFGVLLFEAHRAMPKVYKLIIKNPFWSDVISTVAVIGIFGTSVNGLVASAVFGVINSIMFMMANKYRPLAQDGSDPSLKDTISEVFWGRKKESVPQQKADVIDVKCEVVNA